MSLYAENIELEGKVLLLIEKRAVLEQKIKRLTDQLSTKDRIICKQKDYLNQYMECSSMLRDRLATNREEKQQMIEELLKVVDQQQQKMSVELKKIPKCPVCWLPFNDNILFSVNCGHCLCTSCRPSLINCPKCRGPLHTVKGFL